MMKKLLFSALACIACGAAIAQTTINLPGNYNNFRSADTYTPGTGNFSKQGGTINGWFGPEDFIRNNATGPFQNFIGILFPDSAVVIVDQDNRPNTVVSHAFGHLFDLRHENWAAVPSTPANPILPFAQKDSYTLDSISFFYLYRRNHPDNTVVDTCYISFYKNSENNSIITKNILFGNGDTMRYATVSGLNQNTLAGQAPFLTKTILLTAADTTAMQNGAWLSRERIEHVGTTIAGTAAAGLSRNPKSWFAYTVTFKPGHAWNHGDTVESLGFTRPGNGVNYFGYRYVTITAGGLPTTLRSRDYAENSLLLNNVTRYGQTTANGWSGFMPGTAFNNPVYINARALVVGASSSGIMQAEKLGFSLGNVYPNPVGGGQNLSIGYALKTAAPVTIEIFDLAGKKMATVLDSERVEAGEHTASTAIELKPGVYLYTLQSGGVIISTKKFSVVY